MGLSERVTVLWITAAIFRISYAELVIVEELEKGELTADELESLHLSIGSITP
jgi:cytochrome b561